VVSSFVIADSLRATFDNLVEEIQGDVDITVRAKQDFGSEDNRPRVDADLLPAVLGVDGVAAAAGNVSLLGVVPIDANGDPVTSMGPPLIGVNWDDTPGLEQFIVREGRAPKGPSEFAMDKDAAAKNDFEVGQTYTVS